MKKIAILSSNDVTSDPRINRVIDSTRKKYRVGVFCFVWPYRNENLIERKKNLIIKRFQYLRMAPKQISKIIIAQKDKDTLKKDNNRNDFIYRIIGRITYLYNFYYANKKLAKEASKFRPDIIYANDLDTLLAGWWIKQNTGAKLIYDSHEIWTEQGQDLPGWILKLYKIMEKRLLGKIDALISVNKSILDELVNEYNIKPLYPRVILYNCPNFVKTKKDDCFKSYRKKFKTILFYHGGYMPGRGLEELILAMKFVSNQAILLLRVSNKLIGEQKLQKIIEENKLSERVKIIEPVAMKKMIDESVGADIGIIPYKGVNLNNKYSTPNKLFEYMMAGMAIASSDLVEIKKLLKIYRNGVVFNPEKPKDIAQAINDLLKEKNLSKLKENSLNAAKIFSWKNEEKKLFKIYSDIFAFKNN